MLCPAEPCASIPAPHLHLRPQSPGANPAPSSARSATTGQHGAALRHHGHAESPLPGLLRVSASVPRAAEPPQKAAGRREEAERFGSGTFVPGAVFPPEPAHKGAPLAHCWRRQVRPWGAAGPGAALRPAGWEAGVGAALSGGFDCGVINVSLIWRRTACWGSRTQLPAVWARPGACPAALRCGFVVGISQGKGFCGCSSFASVKRGRRIPALGLGLLVAPGLSSFRAVAFLTTTRGGSAVPGVDRSSSPCCPFLLRPCRAGLEPSLPGQ